MAGGRAGAQMAGADAGTRKHALELPLLNRAPRWQLGPDELTPRFHVDGSWGSPLAEALLDAEHHQVPRRLAIGSTGPAAPGNGSPVEGVDHEGDLHSATVAARNRETVRAPAPIGPNKDPLALRGVAIPWCCSVTGRRPFGARGAQNIGRPFRQCNNGPAIFRDLPATPPTARSRIVGAR